MNIGIDIDDTIAKTSEEVDIYAKEYTENILKRDFKLNEIEILEPMWARHLYNWTIQEDKIFWDLYYEKIMKNLKPKDNAVKVINKLSEKHTIIIITARWDKESGIISKITKDWLDSYEIHYDKLFLNHQDKRNIAIENDIELFIDDNLKTCTQISNMNIKTFLMNSRINKNATVNNITRVSSWEEIEKLMSYII